MSQSARYGVAFIARAANVAKSRTMQQPLRIGLINGSLGSSGSRHCAFAAARSINAVGGAPSIRGFHSGGYQGQSEPSVSPIETSDIGSAGSGEGFGAVMNNALQGHIDMSMGMESAMKIGDLAKHGLDTYLPTRLMEYALEYVHVSTGLPWWATIAAMVVGIRAALFPLAARGQRHLIGVNRLKPELTLITEKQRIASRNGDVMASAQFTQQMQGIYKQNGVSLWAGVVGGVSPLPFMMSLFFGLKHMASIPEVTHMHTGGLWWFRDLTLADPYYILPALSTIGMMGVMELQSKLNTPTEQSKNMIYGMRAAGVFMAYFTSGLPAGVFVFWITNNLLSYAQVALFHTKWFKDKMGIADLEKVKFARKPESMLDKINVQSILGKQKKSSKFVVKHK